MIELDPILVIILLEILGGLILLVIGFLLFSRIKNAADQVAAEELIDGLKETQNIQNNKLRKIISEFCSVEKDEVDSCLSEITQSEQVLYKQIITLFLNKDPLLLPEIGQYIDSLSDPYLKLLGYSSSDFTNTENLETAENKINNLMVANQKIADQLTIAMQTIDEISTEYTRVFSGTQTELELENSLKRMLNIFHTAELQVKAPFKDQEQMEIQSRT